MDDHRGAEVVVVIAKAAYRVSPLGDVKLDAAPIRLAPEGGGPRGSVRYPSDFVFAKPGTDVLLVGTAHPPAGAPVTFVDVTLRVWPAEVATALGGGVDAGARPPLVDRTARVHGPRVFYQGVGVVPGPAGRLEDPVPLLWENTYGGTDDASPRRVAFEPKNPIGTGFAVDRAKLVGTLAPPIEDPRAPLGSRSPAPAGFGPVNAEWEPRAALAGTFDERWRTERAPVLPEDFDVKHNAVAPPGLWCATPLVGDELVEVLGATPEGAWRFRLPRYEPSFACVIGGERRELEAHLDTFLVDADEGRVELTWRAAFRLPRKSERVERIEVVARNALPDSVFGEPAAPARAEGPSRPI
jgi:hypothetical protein